MAKLPPTIRDAFSVVETFLADEHETRSIVSGPEVAEYVAAPLQAMRALKSIQAYIESKRK